MHCEYLSALDSCDAVEEPEDGVLCVAVEPSCATCLLGEPPHAATVRARPAAMKAAAIPAVGGDARRRRRPAWVLSLIAHQRRSYSCAGAEGGAVFS